jgi:diguanylate cyclase (GGDEF)-like protein/PAS domain S-box-containing protein
MTMQEANTAKILVVDDRSENLAAMRHILARLEGEIVCVNSGNEALKQLLRDEFAVVLMDVQMPDMNGFETAEIIRNNEDTKALPIIFVTAISKEKRYVDQGYELGAVDYLFKPFDPQILRYKVSVFTELFRQRNSFHTLARKNKLILDSVKDGVLGIDTLGHIVFCNPAAVKLLQPDGQSLTGQNINKFICGQESTAWQSSNIYDICTSGSTFCRSDLQFYGPKGEPFPVECTATAMREDKNTLDGFVMVISDISERLKAEQQLAQLAEYDPLTGLANRRLFYRLLPQLLAKAKRTQHQVALLFIDIDHFKSINDSLGHVVGDLLLAQVAARLVASVRDSDTVVRLGGDEFTIILEGELNHAGVAKLADNIIASMASPFTINQHQTHCSVSIGIALAPETSQEPNQLIKAADAAMYNAKAQGRNNYQFYDESLSQQVSYRAQVEMQLKQAIDNGEFHLVYQPKITLTDGTLKGFEALIRWNSPSLGKISPAVFIPIAEDGGRIEEIGDWVFLQACRQLCEWQRLGLTGDGFSLSVNFSTKQLTNTQFLQRMEAIVKETDVNPANLDIEITETTLMTSPDAIVPLLRVLSHMGMTISVDDFGTGYSSLNYLKLLPLDFLKVDQSFVRDLFKDTNSEIITRSIIHLAHNLGLKVVAEGVESAEQSAFLQQQGCDLGQGYYYGKPMSAKKALACFSAGNQKRNAILRNGPVKRTRR